MTVPTTQTKTDLAKGLGAGLVAATLLDGPVGWLVGGLVAAFFAILPGLFSHQAAMPSKGNIAEAIQYKFFGDASHT